MKKKKEPFADALNQCLLKELDLLPPEVDMNDPYLALGYGVNAYFSILGQISKMFFWIFLFSMPIYYAYGIYGQNFSEAGSYPVSRWFAGNLGGSSMFCKQTRLS